MDRQNDQQRNFPKPGVQAAEEDLTRLLSSASEENPDGGQADAGQNAPDEALSELLEVIEGEAESDAVGGRTDEATDQPSTAAVRDMAAPSEPSLPAVPCDDELPSQPEARGGIANESGDSSETSSDDDAFEAASSEVAKGSGSPASGELPVAETEELPSDAAQVSRPEWSRYLETAKALAGQILARADMALDALHPRARDAVGVAGVAMLALAFGLFVTQLLGWI